MSVNIENVDQIIKLACEAKVVNCIKSVAWDEDVVCSALRNADFDVMCTQSVISGDKLESVSTFCVVRFLPNELPGIIVPVNCILNVDVVRNRETGQYEASTHFDSIVLVRASDNREAYNIKSLQSEFQKKKPTLSINEFVNKDFDFEELCKQYSGTSKGSHSNKE